MKYNFPRIIINMTNRENYIKTLEQAQASKKYSKFSKFIYDQLELQQKDLDNIFEDSKNAITEILIKNYKNKQLFTL